MLVGCLYLKSFSKETQEKFIEEISKIPDVLYGLREVSGKLDFSFPNTQANIELFNRCLLLLSKN